MPSTETDRTLSGGRQGGKTRWPSHDVSNEFNRLSRRAYSEASKNNYKPVLDSNGNKIFMIRKEHENDYYVCSYSEPKNVDIMIAAFEAKIGRKPPQNYMRTWINEPEISQKCRDMKFNIYYPVGAPYIAANIEGVNKPFANYDIDGQIVSMQLEFMDRILNTGDRYNLLLQLSEADRGEVLQKLLESYYTLDTKTRAAFLKENINKFLETPTDGTKPLKRS